MRRLKDDVDHERAGASLQRPRSFVIQKKEQDKMLTELEHEFNHERAGASLQRPRSFVIQKEKEQDAHRTELGAKGPLACYHERAETLHRGRARS